MNANRNLMIKFCVDRYEKNKIGITRKTGSRVDHVINDPKDRHTQPHQPKRAATKPYKLYHNHKEEQNV